MKFLNAEELTDWILQQRGSTEDPQVKAGLNAVLGKINNMQKINTVDMFVGDIKPTATGKILHAGTQTVGEIINLLMHYPNQEKPVESIDTFEDEIVVHTLDELAIYIGREKGAKRVSFEEYRRKF